MAAVKMIVKTGKVQYQKASRQNMHIFMIVLLDFVYELFFIRQFSLCLLKFSTAVLMGLKQLTLKSVMQTSVISALSFISSLKVTPRSSNFSSLEVHGESSVCRGGTMEKVVGKILFMLKLAKLRELRSSEKKKKVHGNFYQRK